jgi:hypothetical protein
LWTILVPILMRICHIFGLGRSLLLSLIDGGMSYLDGWVVKEGFN